MKLTKKINIESLPTKPGVYHFRSADGKLLYIGKANNLRSRVFSYFHKSAQLPPSKQIMIDKISKVEFIITSSEVEALLLESSLIKRHQPPYNIQFKDDKNFLYIKITTNEEFPRVFTVRRLADDKAKYYGPFISAWSVRQVLHTLRQIFPHRNFPKPPSAHQLRYLIKRYPQLLGPADHSEYQKTIQQIIKFLNGNYHGIVKELTEMMKHRSEKKQFELAASLRDKIQAIKKVMAKQNVISMKRENQDIISLAREQQRTAINVFAVRQGKLTAKQDFILDNTSDKTDGEILQTFIERFYAQHTNLPQQVIVPVKLPNSSLIKKTFGCTVLIPKKGNKKRYLNLGYENALNHLEQQKASWEKNKQKIEQALLELKKYLKLKKIPGRIEVFDISNIQGVNAVGSMIVFTGGQPDKKWYRKFKIKTVRGANDTAMMAEILQRRFHHVPSQSGQPWPRPDLIIIDGGKGQLNAVLNNLPTGIKAVAIAKRHEDIYLPERKAPINFPGNSDALFLIQRMRDEAHRFAITFYRKSHKKSMQQSPLNNITGLGPKTKKKLLSTFGTLEKIKLASFSKLSKIVGAKLAKTIKENL